MGSSNDAALTDALASIQHVRKSRQALTSEAAGLVWQLWGFVMLAIGLANQVMFLGGKYGNLQAPWVGEVTILVFAALGGLVTRSIFKMLVIDIGRPSWVPWAYGAAGLMVTGGLVAASNVLFPLRAPGVMLAPLALGGAVLALTLTLLFRKQVRVLPGFIGAGVLLVLFLNFTLADFSVGVRSDVFGNAAVSFANLATFLMVGLVYARSR